MMRATQIANKIAAKKMMTLARALGGPDVHVLEAFRAAWQVAQSSADYYKDRCEGFRVRGDLERSDTQKHKANVSQAIANDIKIKAKEAGYVW